MTLVKPFRGLRPAAGIAHLVSSRPYDVLNSAEARAETGDNVRSFYHIIRPEINFPEGTDEHDPRVYPEARRQLERFIAEGWLVQDERECYYLYAQTMNGHTQYGIVLAAHVDDYNSGRIKKHELTRRDKEDDRMRHLTATNAHIGSAFLAYRRNDTLQALIERIAEQKPLYDFVADVDGFRHTLWLIDAPTDIETITREFGKMDALYIADGHHRSAAAARVGTARAEANPEHTGREEYNYYLAVCFPAEQLTILDYNRVVRDLNGLTPDELLGRLEEDFEVRDRGPENFRPEHAHQFALYLGGRWYSLDARPGTFDPEDPIGVLDVDISSRLILDKQLGITDLRSSKRVDFVGGLRGLDELRRRVDSGEMQAALALYPVTMEQVMRIADTGNIMPPKATWFEPKLRTGMVIHDME